MSGKPLRLAVFDLDGTIVDSKHNIVRAVSEVALSLGLKAPPPDKVPRVIGLSLLDALAALFPDLDATAHKDLDRRYREIFARMRGEPDYNEPLFEGTLEVLDQLDKAGFLLGIATGKATRGVNYVLDRHKLTSRFVTVSTPDNAPGKPHPGMILRAMAEMGVEERNTVVIGDTTYDIQMALGAGAHAVGVSWGNHPAAELRAAGAHRLIDRLDDLLHAAETLTAPVLAPS